MDATVSCNKLCQGSDHHRVRLCKRKYLGSQRKMTFKNHAKSFKSLETDTDAIPLCDDRLQHNVDSMELRIQSQITCSKSRTAFEQTAVELAPSSSAPSSLSSPSSSSSISANTTELHSNNLVNFYQSCHLPKFTSLNFLNDCKHTVYKFQKTSK